MFDPRTPQKTPRTRRPVTVVSRSQLPPRTLRPTAPPPVNPTQRDDETAALGNPFDVPRSLYRLQAIDARDVPTPVEVIAMLPGVLFGLALFMVSLLWLAVLP